MFSDFSYVQSMYSSLLDSIFDSNLMVMATVNIMSEGVPENSISSRFGDTMDARTTPVKKDYPDFIDKYYRVNLYPTEHGLKITDSTGLVATPLGKVDNYDVWMSCKEEDALVRGDSSMFDFADNVQLEGTRYNVRAVVKELFGTTRILHIFLTKETDE